jgi:hypothetical protein
LVAIAKRAKKKQRRFHINAYREVQSQV